MNTPTLYARTEPTTDADLLKHKPDTQVRDVVLYHDKGLTEPAGRYSWDRTGKPKASDKTTRLNCSLWALVWLDPKSKRESQLEAELKQAADCLMWASQEADRKVKREVVGGWIHHAARAYKLLRDPRYV